MTDMAQGKNDGKGDGQLCRDQVRLEQSSKGQCSGEPFPGLAEKELVHTEHQKRQENRSHHFADSRSCVEIDQPVLGQGVEKGGCQTDFAGMAQAGEGVISDPGCGKIAGDKQQLITANRRHPQKAEQGKRIEKELGIRIPMRHCANSAGIVEMPQSGLDAVRAGIILYGLWPSDEVKRDIVSLRPALSLYSRIIFIKEVKAGEQISYGGTFTAKEDMRVATVPAGYGDGYPRSLSGQGYVLIAGKRAPILGRVCMDQFMVDVTHIPEAEENGLVTLIGTDGDESISMELLGDLSGRFNYELACCLNRRVPRVYKKDGKTVYTKDNFRDFS